MVHNKYGAQQMNHYATFDFLRHGKTERDDIFRGITDIPLSSAGWEQMLNALKNENERWDAVISSPLIRCKLFAQSVAYSLNIPFKEDERLKEYDFGDWDGKPYTEVLHTQHKVVENFFLNPEKLTPPNGENYIKFKRRIIGYWEELQMNTPSGKRILIVSHGGVILVILGYVLGVRDIHRKIQMSYASRSRIQFGHRAHSVRLIFHR